MRDLVYIAVFQKVVETKGFTAAARELGMTTSAISRQVSRLEETLGVQLLVRNTRHIRLTEAGATFYERSARGLIELEGAKAAVSKLRADLHGTLNVIAPSCFGRLHVIPAVNDFLALHPQLTINVSFGLTVANLADSDFDILIRSAVLENSNIAFEHLAPMQHIVCATPRYLRKNGVPKMPKDLARHNCLVLMRPYPNDEWRFAGPRGGQRVQVSGNFRGDSMEALYAAVMNHLGVARIPNYVITPDVKAGRLKPIFSDLLGTGNRREGPAITMKAYYTRSPYPVPKIQSFIAFLKERFSGNQNWERRSMVR